ncbi:YhbP family protein [Mixta sp. Marseille-Q2659]|uniref:YhbP family protein n=1 Tax=Mixta sp. Marseille-Q2659 TaxID=2736607 RepID=UPI0023BA0831|nr:YhbP family protein [Mixta sp. Marseille-Q2659]
MSDVSAIIRYLKKQHVLSLCCRDEETFWCANCFYAFDEARMVFWIMTEANTRHGALMTQQPQVAGTVSGQTKTVMLIKGIQYRGEARLLNGEEDKQARAAYCQRFPVARAVSAPLWEIRLDEVKMTDNTLGFGKKNQWLRDEV